MNIGIIGCGLMGQKRLKALSREDVVIAFDPNEDRACQMALSVPSGRVGLAGDWQSIARDPEIEAVIVSTPHNMLAEIARQCAWEGKHVLIEKPGAMREGALNPILEAKSCVRVGFNHRHHHAMRKAREIVDSGAIGPLLYVRGRYGHGGRPGMENEWRCDPEQSGGGELIDQGVHLIDLARWFLGDFTKVHGLATRQYWQSTVEDNAFLLLSTAAGKVAHLHASWTEWKNTFSFEIFGVRGKVEITGLGGSYGVERCTLYQMLPEMGPPETTTWEYPMADDSFEFEWAEFLDDIRLKRSPRPGIADAQAALRIVEQIYAGK